MDNQSQDLDVTLLLILFVEALIDDTFNFLKNLALTRLKVRHCIIHFVSYGRQLLKVLAVKIA